MHRYFVFPSKQDFEDLLHITENGEYQLKNVNHAIAPIGDVKGEEGHPDGFHVNVLEWGSWDDHAWTQYEIETPRNPLLVWI